VLCKLPDLRLGGFYDVYPHGLYPAFFQLDLFWMSVLVLIRWDSIKISEKVFRNVPEGVSVIKREC
jgi:hypothetical protein